MTQCVGGFYDNLYIYFCCKPVTDIPIHAALSSFSQALTRPKSRANLQPHEEDEGVVNDADKASDEDVSENELMAKQGEPMDQEGEEEEQSEKDDEVHASDSGGEEDDGQKIVPAAGGTATPTGYESEAAGSNEEKEVVVRRRRSTAGKVKGTFNAPNRIAQVSGKGAVLRNARGQRVVASKTDPRCLLCNKGPKDCYRRRRSSKVMHHKAFCGSSLLLTMLSVCFLGRRFDYNTLA